MRVRLPDDSKMLSPGLGSGLPALFRGAGHLLATFLDVLGAEQPVVDIIRNGHEPLIVDPLAVDGRHARIGVPHDVIHGHLVPAAAGDGLESVAERIES